MADQTIRPKLTKRTVDAIEPPKEGSRIVYDAELTGFFVEVSAAGRRTYKFAGRTKGGRQVKLKIGVHGQITADIARDLARVQLGKLAAGEDPSAERRSLKDAERARREAPTMREFASEYLDYASAHKRTVDGDRAMLDNAILPRLGSKKLRDVTHADVEALHSNMISKPYQANRCLALMSAMMNVAIRRGLRPDNPARGVKRYHEEKRERYLSGHEIARLSDALAAHSNHQSANAVRLLLLTGARRGEVLGATWSQFDLDAGVWVKPSSHTKQKKEHRVPMSPAAVELLQAMNAEAEERAQRARQRRALFKRSPFVFPGGAENEHLTEIKKFWRSVCKTAEIEGVRLHDLRHTYASILASSGLSLPIIGQLLGHTQPSTTARYAHLADDPLRAATTAVADKLAKFAAAPRKGRLVAVEQKK